MKSTLFGLGLTAMAIALAPAARANPAQKTACDFNEISEFLQWFGGSAENQKAASADPLEAAFEEKDETGKKLPLEFDMTPHDELGWPILPTLGAMQAQFNISILPQSADHVIVNTVGGLAYNHTYHFKRAPCWTLVKFIYATI